MAILGIDEVGRGPLAGPLVIGAVILPEPRPEWVEDLRDSKKLTAKKREGLESVILKEAPATGLGWVAAAELDEMGISAALSLAAKRAVKAVQSLHAPFSQIVIDGKVNFLKGTALENYVSTMVKADDLVKEVSAASIIAKVARDRYMAEAAEKYPGYGFEKNVGYGTKVHFEALSRLGLSPEHRRSFEPCKSMVGFSREEKSVVKNTTLVGRQGETAVAEYLSSRGHEIVARNFKTKRCEIDVVSVYEDRIYFTEVKYRENSWRGNGLEVITPKKLAQMRFSAEVFLKTHPEFSRLNPLLAAASVGGEFEVEEWLEIV